MIQPNEYQDLTGETEIYSEAAEHFVAELDTPQVKWLKLAYCTGKLNGEAGECAEIVFKAFRGSVGVISSDDKKKLEKELGDVLWYVARIAALLNVPLESIMQQNIAKLLDRKNRGILHGYGDDR